MLYSMKMGGFMLAAFLPVACEAARVRAGVQFLAKQLSEGAGTPSTVAEKLLTIENDWDDQVRLTTECEAKSGGDCQSPPPLFQQSCSAVATSFASRGGDRAGVQSFMTAVCGADALTAPSRGQCQILATFLEDEMATGKAADAIDTNNVCQQFWTQLLQNARAEEQRNEQADAAAAAKAAAAAVKTAAATPPASVQEQQQVNGTGQKQLNVIQKALGAGQAAGAEADAQSEEDGESSDDGDDSEDADGEDQSDQDGGASDSKDDAEDQAGDDKDDNDA